VIAIGSTRKPTDRIRSFIKELTRVVPNTVHPTRGKQGFSEFCEAATSAGASRILLVGAWHGNPGRLVFLEHKAAEGWVFQPPTVLLKSVTLLRDLDHDPPSRQNALYVVPNTSLDAAAAESLATALEAPLRLRDNLPANSGREAVLRVALHARSVLEFLSPDEKEPLGPTIYVREFLDKALGDVKRW
jgi:U3 small nucleolar ribonucleoprotein protein IMP4